MNQNDINAARKLIAQFHGKALGRHNSNMFNRAEERQEPAMVPVFYRITVKDKPEDCAVGEYCWKIPGDDQEPEIPVVRMMNPVNPELRFNGEFRLPSMHEHSYREFERVSLVVSDARPRNQRRKAWRRIA